MASVSFFGTCFASAEGTSTSASRMVIAIRLIGERATIEMAERSSAGIAEPEDVSAALRLRLAHSLDPPDPVGPRRDRSPEHGGASLRIALRLAEHTGRVAPVVVLAVDARVVVLAL